MTSQTRHILMYLCFFGVLNVYLSRLNMSIAVVQIVKERNETNNSNNNITNNADNMWTIANVGDLLASYYYGYIWTQIPGAWLAHKYGFKKVRNSIAIIT